MRLRATFSKIVETRRRSCYLIKLKTAGKEFGYAEYNGVRLNIEDMLP